MRVIVLGAGLVGGPMAVDLAGEFEVSVADVDASALERLSSRADITPVVADLSDPDAVTALAADHDLVVSAVPGFLGFATLGAVIAAGRNVVDIAFAPEDPFSLDDAAKRHGVVAIVDCGVVPGLSNALIGSAVAALDEVERVIVYVGGLPQVRTWPWEYKAVFSPIDVIEEYTRPARLIEGGAEVVRPALSEVELIDFPGVGTLEAFNTDGLRTLLSTIRAPEMKEKTLRYPGHAEKMAMLREAGFFSAEPVTIDAGEVRPIDLTARLLFPAWRLPAGEGDVTVLQVVVEGSADDKRVRHVYDLVDRYDPDTGTTSMARTTGYTATMAARLIADGRWNRPGITPPEHLAQVPGCVEYLLAGLAERGVTVHHDEQQLD